LGNYIRAGRYRKNIDADLVNPLVMHGNKNLKSLPAFAFPKPSSKKSHRFAVANKNFSKGSLNPK
jgi:hypothetical protein